jgi:phage I-like protein
MSRYATPTTREEQLEAVLDRLPFLEEAYEEACRDYAEASTNYRVAKAQAYLNAEGTIQQRENTATDKTANLLRERDRTEAIKEAVYMKLRDCQLVISARQSLLRVDMNTSAALGGGYNGR